MSIVNSAIETVSRVDFGGIIGTIGEWGGRAWTVLSGAANVAADKVLEVVKFIWAKLSPLVGNLWNMAQPYASSPTAIRLGAGAVTAFAGYQLWNEATADTLRPLHIAGCATAALVGAALTIRGGF